MSAVEREAPATPAAVEGRMSSRSEAAYSLLRVSVGLLVLWWGIDKIVNVEHALAVSDRFYLGLFSSGLLLQAWGVLQSAAAVLYIAGKAGRWVYPLILLMNTVSILGVWSSIVDPWGFVLEGTNALFFPSLTIFAASLLIWLRDLDRRRLQKQATGSGS